MRLESATDLAPRLAPPLVNRAHGRLSVNIQCGGDLNYAPGVLWTAAHHRIPLLTVMHNNRAYHQERMFLADMAGRVQRDVQPTGIGNDLTDPTSTTRPWPRLRHARHRADREPERPRPALKRAIEIVKRGEPVLVDVVTQPR